LVVPIFTCTMLYHFFHRFFLNPSRWAYYRNVAMHFAENFPDFFTTSFFIRFQSHSLKIMQVDFRSYGPRLPQLYSFSWNCFLKSDRVSFFFPSANKIKIHLFCTICNESREFSSGESCRSASMVITTLPFGPFSKAKHAMRHFFRSCAESELLLM
jgi:hypothetical protein